LQHRGDPGEPVDEILRPVVVAACQLRDGALRLRVRERLEAHERHRMVNGIDDRYVNIAYSRKPGGLVDSFLVSAVYHRFERSKSRSTTVQRRTSCCRHSGTASPLRSNMPTIEPTGLRPTRVNTRTDVPAPRPVRIHPYIAPVLSRRQSLTGAAPLKT
jgi:hypothetical protein